MRSSTRHRLAAALAVALALACGGERPPPTAPARRIASLAPSLTELLFAIGAGDRVVGRTRYCDYPPAALAVPSVGEGLDFNVEAVAGRAPDLVVIYPTASNDAAAERLRALGIHTASFRTDGLDDLIRAGHALGRLAGVSRQADSVTDAFATALDSARAAPRPLRPPRVLILAWDQPPIVIGGGSFQSELVTLAGGTNVFGDIAAPSSQVSLETVAARDPDVVLLTSDGTPTWAERPEWRAVRAVRERRFVAVTGSEFSRPSFRALDAVRRLHEALLAVRP